MQEVQPQRVSSPPVFRLIAVVVLAVLLVAGGAVVFAGRSPSGASGAVALAADASQDPNASAAPDASNPPASPMPGKGNGGPRGPGGFGGFGRGGFGRGPIGGFGGFGGFGFGGPGRPGGPGLGGSVGSLLPDGSHAISITAIDGNNLSLATSDGWSRTIDASTAKVTRDGTAITVADLKVGDNVRFAETRNSDGTYTITEIAVVTPRVAGTVTAIDADTITLSQVDGTMLTVNVSSSTTFQVPGVTTPTIADIKVGNLAVAAGTLATDGSMDATSVTVFNGTFRGPTGRGPGGNGQPGASPSPSSPPSG